MGEFLVVVGAYLIGSIPFSLIVGKLMAGVDIRKQGSGNVGATNVLRSLGTQGAILALIADALKGVAAVWAGLLVGGAMLAAVCGVAVVLGHCFSVFLSFKGGKGVATSGGIVLFLMPKVILALLAAFILIVFLSRYVSLGSITVAALLPVLAFTLNYDFAYVLMSLVLAFIVIWHHKDNITRLKEGTESKIGQRI